MAYIWSSLLYFFYSFSYAYRSNSSRICLAPSGKLELATLLKINVILPIAPTQLRFIPFFYLLVTSLFLSLSLHPPPLPLSLSFFFPFFPFPIFPSSDYQAIYRFALIPGKFTAFHCIRTTASQPSVIASSLFLSFCLIVVSQTKPHSRGIARSSNRGV